MVHQFCCCSVTKSWLTPCDPMDGSIPSFLSFTISQSLLKFKSMDLVILSNHLILCHPLLLLPSIFPSIKIFSNELALCIRWPNYWSFIFSISLSNECSGLISSGIDLLAAPGTLESLLQHQTILLFISRLQILILHRPLHLLPVACEVLTRDQFS